MVSEHSDLADLKEYACVATEEIDLGRLALAMVAPDHDGISVDRYVQHLEAVNIEVKARFDALIESGALDDCGTRLAALKYVLCNIYDYRTSFCVEGQEGATHIEILECADMMRVIDRAIGCSAALAVLYMNAARAQGWHIEGLDFPDVFLCRLEVDGARVIFDPSAQCRMLEAHDLRGIIKEKLGERAELSADYYNGLDARATITHLYNKIKHRYIAMGDYRSALDMIMRLRIVSPDEYRLLLDAGVLAARLNENAQAITCLKSYIEHAPDDYTRQEALQLLEALL